MLTAEAEQRPIDYHRRGRRSSGLFRIAGWSLLASAGLIGAFLVYQLWGTGLYTGAAQTRLEQELAGRISSTSVVAPPLPPTTLGLGSPPSPEAAPAALPPPLIVELAVAEGEALGRILIPTADVDDVIVSGVTRETLKLGPGHMPWTPLPGQPGNSVISGHRTTYGAPFFYLDEVLVGDDITVETAIGRHVYRVREIFVVEPTDVWVTEPRPGAWLTLTTCTPRYSAAQRLIIAAELVEGPNLLAIEAPFPVDLLATSGLGTRLGAD